MDHFEIEMSESARSNEPGPKSGGSGADEAAQTGDLQEAECVDTSGI